MAFTGNIMYRTPLKEGACAVQIGNYTDFHERCHCSAKAVNLCKGYCDLDKSCKGYVEVSHVSLGCQYATTSACNSGCTKYDANKVGKLVIDSTDGSRSYRGCYIKATGLLCYF